MNIHYPIHERANQSMLLVLVAAMFLISLVAVFHIAYQPVAVNIGNPVHASGSQAIPHPVPVPEPPLNQPALQPHLSVSPVSPGIQPHPVPQPIPAPQSGQ